MIYSLLFGTTASYTISKLAKLDKKSPKAKAKIQSLKENFVIKAAWFPVKKTVDFLVPQIKNFNRNIKTLAEKISRNCNFPFKGPGKSI